MELVSLSCGECGASLDLPEKARFVTCTYCKAKLVVKREGGAAFTELQQAIEEVGDRAEALEREVGALKKANLVRELDDEMQEIERDWEERRRSLMTKAKDGELVVPTKSAAYMMAVAAAGLAIAVVALGSSTTGVLVFGLAGAILILGLAWLLHGRAERYLAAELDFEERRDEARRRLQAARSDETETSLPRAKKRSRPSD